MRRCLWCGSEWGKRTGTVRDGRGREESWGCDGCGATWRLEYVGRRQGREPTVRYWVLDEGMTAIGRWVMVPAGCMLVKGDL